MSFSKNVHNILLCSLLWFRSRPYPLSCYTGTSVIAWLPQYLWYTADEYGTYFTRTTKIYYAYIRTSVPEAGIKGRGK